MASPPRTAEDWRAAEQARRTRERERFVEVMRQPSMQVAAHEVKGGDALFCGDEKWRPVLASFGENTSSATVWAIYCTVEGEPTKRIAGDPAAVFTIRRPAAPQPARSA